MTKLERLEWCNQCTNRSFDPKYGRTCGLTGREADFTDTCPAYVHDEAEKEKLLTDRHRQKMTNAVASKGLRFANYVIDMVVYLVLLFALVFFLGLIGGLGLLGSSLWLNLIALFMNFTYYTAMESATGQTIGKMITGTIVVDANGDRPSTSTIMLRSLCRFIPFEAVSFLGEGTGWHDHLTKTMVVRKKYFTEDIEI